MKIYHIYYEEIEYDYKNFEDKIDYEEKIIKHTVKYVDSLDKYYSFLNEINKNNETLPKCNICPLIKLTKRKYLEQKEKYSKFKCDSKYIFFNGNGLYCKGLEYFLRKKDDNNYLYEEIEVE